MGSHTFRQRYELLKVIGHPGSYGKVHAVTRKATGQPLAVKIIKKPTQALTKRDEIRAAMVKSESIIMRSIRHEHVVNVVDVIESSSQVFIVMEQCLGGDLFDKVGAYGGKIPESSAAIIFRDLLHAVAHIHSERYEKMFHVLDHNR